MTGRELIIYILENNLEDTDMSTMPWLETMEEAAVRLGVGIATVDAWYKLKRIKGIVIGETTYILRGAEPMLVERGEKDE